MLERLACISRCGREQTNIGGEFGHAQIEAGTECRIGYLAFGYQRLHFGLQVVIGCLKVFAAAIEARQFQRTAHGLVNLWIGNGVGKTGAFQPLDGGLNVTLARQQQPFHITEIAIFMKERWRQLG